LNEACAPVIDAAKKVGAAIWVVNEYSHLQVDQEVVYLNRRLREKGHLVARDGPFGEQLETYASRAFAVCDHQIAHVYVNDPRELPSLYAMLALEPGVGYVHVGRDRGAIGLDHDRA